MSADCDALRETVLSKLAELGFEIHPRQWSLYPGQATLSAATIFLISRYEHAQTHIEAAQQAGTCQIRSSTGQ